MKKLIIGLLLILCFQAAKSQWAIPGYTYIAQRYVWFGGLFRALNIPAGDSAQFQPGQVVRAGAIYYDSTGVDSGLYVWSGLAWQKQNANNYTASQGITLSGNDFQLGGLMTDIKSLTWNGGNSEMTFGQIYGTQKYGRGNLNVVNIDTMPNPDTSRFWGLNSHTIFRSPSYTASIYRLGTNLQVTYENADSVNLRSFGGDFGSAVRSNFHFKRLPGYTGRSVYEIGNKTLSDIIPIHIANLDWGDESSTAGTNYKYVRGYMGGFSAYLVTRANDTLTNWVGFNSHGFGDGYVNWAADYVGGFLGNASTTNVGKHWYLYNRGQYSPSWMASALYIGDSTLTPSALLNVSSTTQGVVWSRMTTAQKNAIASPVTGLIVYDTDLSNYYFYNGSAWTVMGGSSITNFNDIGDATAAGLVTVGNNTQQWDFTGLTGSGLLIQSNTTAATSFLHKLFRVITTGANATSSVRSFASEISNSHSGTNSTNVGLIASAINGTNNYAIVVGAGNGQIGFGTDTPDPSALLDVSSTTQGALLPRMTTAQQDAITSPANGLLIYNTDSSLFRFYDGAWNSIAAGSSGSGSGDVTKVGTPSNHQWGIWTGDGTLEGVTVTGSRAVVTDADGEPVAATTTATEIGYVNGVTSAIQTQIDSKASGSITQNWFDDDLTINGVTTKINRADVFDDMLTTPNSTAGTSYMLEFASGTGADASIGNTAGTVPDGNGWSVFQTGTTTAGIAALATTSVSVAKNIVDTTKAYRFETKLQLETLSDDTEDYRIVVGLMAYTTNTSAVNQIWFRYNDNTNSGNWTCYSSNAATTEATNSGVAAAAGSSVTLAFEYDNAAVKFYINGSLVATNATNFPVHNSATFHPVIAMTKTAGTTNRIAYVDYVKYRKL